MEVFEAKPKRWGNSLGITIPKDIVQKERISAGKMIRILVVCDESKKVKRTFGTLELKKPTQKVLEEIDAEY